ncbi:hypothetical protein THASP1DRAFT_21916 [Thamnocephalis sphaerospora]|uniref:Uncharacterized protein n=1 Tax=Thamnocephalis sphaerospora TaxID=78915 RepID=A0A4P9XVS0_9FUNG|nr:hypothetical protein THASP1DRAFT_21916 [Thamnocephalis sphaerospora]|eukprot:RKP10368.1 hypothetical protein THASP1DRAFT_21916 [Thamnocephalis sphaerospora]
MALRGGQATLLAAVLFLLLQISGIYMFTRGFLLTRLALEEQSQCAVLPAVNSSFGATQLPTGAGCWHERRFQRAVVVIVDALRFDFTVYNASYPQPEHYRNRLPVLHDMLVNQPEHAALFEFVADPPTTTLQRLKGLTTGTLPTFIDAGSNFAGSAVTEDSWIAQATAQGLRVWQMGDDTWDALYPDSFAEAHPFPSLNVWDLHTVDNGILALLPDALGPRRNEWDILVTHYLGVDHCGHRYGPQHPAMSEKLTQMNHMLSELMSKMDDDTVLFLFGDHGMDTKGDHGGDSDIEVQAALFVYSKAPLLPKDRGALNKVLRQLAEEAPDDASMRMFVERNDIGMHRTLPQIDLVPTLSMLLGLPVPYSSLGMAIPELFLMSGASANAATEHASGEHLASRIRTNAYQILRYMDAYAALKPSGELAGELQKGLHDKFKIAEGVYEQFVTNKMRQNGDATVASPDAYEVFLAYARFMRAALSSCRRIWAQFDVPLMCAGIVLQVITAFCMFGVMRRSSLSVHTVLAWMRGLLIGTVVTVILQRIRLVPLFLRAIGLASMQRHSQVILGAYVGFLIAFALCGRSDNAEDADTPPERTTRYSRWPSMSVDDSMAWLALPAIQGMIFSSNSFTVFEDHIVLALLQTYGTVSVVRAVAALVGNRSAALPARRHWLLWSLAFLTLGRMSGQTTICREEQGTHCTPTFYADMVASASQSTLIQLVAVAALVPWLLRRVFSATDSFHGVARLWIDWGLRAALLLSATFWIMDETPSVANGDDATNHPSSAIGDVNGAWGGLATVTHTSEDGAWGALKRFVARLGFGMSLIVGVVVWRYSPLCMNVDLKATADTTGGTRHTRQTRGAAAHVAPDARRALPILGFSNAYGAAYMILVTVVYAALAQTQQPSGGLTLAIGVCHLVVFLEMLHAQRIVTRASAKQPAPLPSPFAKAVVLGLLAQHYFFTTGHQATLSSIQWRVGFVGLRDLNWVVSPLLMVANTVGSHLLFTVAVPLLVLWRVSPHVAADDVDTPTTATLDGRRTFLGYRRIWPPIRQAVFAWSLVWTVLAVATCIWSMYFRRHLMVWKVWAPRFMLAAITAVICQVFLILVSFLVGVMHVMRKVGEILAAGQSPADSLIESIATADISAEEGAQRCAA